uniref:Uncharacterized protein n=1 Tax=Bactrocera dorsalis TaxID=27457 RepID=A0A034W4V8_BACDO
MQLCLKITCENLWENFQVKRIEFYGNRAITIEVKKKRRFKKEAVTETAARVRERLCAGFCVICILNVSAAEATIQKQHRYNSGNGSSAATATFIIIVHECINDCDDDDCCFTDSNVHEHNY